MSQKNIKNNNNKKRVYGYYETWRVTLLHLLCQIVGTGRATTNKGGSRFYWSEPPDELWPQNSAQPSWSLVRPSEEPRSFTTTTKLMAISFLIFFWPSYILLMSWFPFNVVISMAFSFFFLGNYANMCHALMSIKSLLSRIVFFFWAAYCCSRYLVPVYIYIL